MLHDEALVVMILF